MLWFPHCGFPIRLPKSVYYVLPFFSHISQFFHEVSWWRLGSINFNTYLEANSASNGEGMGKTGKSLVEMPRCWRLMCECKELRDFATVPHNTHLYPGHTVCLSSMCVLKVCADRYTLPHLGQGLGSVARTRIISNLPPTGYKIH